MPSATIQVTHGNATLSGVALPVVFLRAIEFSLNESIIADDRPIRISVVLGGNLKRRYGCMNYYQSYIKLYITNIDSLTQLLETTFHEFGHFDHHIRHPESALASYEEGHWTRTQGEQYADDYMNIYLRKFFDGSHQIVSADLRHFESLKALNSKMLLHSHKRAKKIYSRYKW